MVMLSLSDALSPSASLPASKSLTQVLLSYVASEAPNLSASYTWPVDEARLHKHLQLKVTGENKFAKNLDLRRKLTALWEGAPDRRGEIAAYRVQFWGGIPVASCARIGAMVESIEVGHAPRFGGIAAWSRVAAVADPHSWATFDARVSLSLNALQFLSGSADVVIFPILPSRERVIRRVGALLHQIWSGRVLERLPVSEVFPAYIELVRRCARTLDVPLPTAHVEMVLFAKAEDLAQRAEIVACGVRFSLPRENATP
jgi:hypothetical protein